MIRKIKCSGCGKKFRACKGYYGKFNVEIDNVFGDYLHSEINLCPECAEKYEERIEDIADDCFALIKKILNQKKFVLVKTEKGKKK